MKNFIKFEQMIKLHALEVVAGQAALNIVFLLYIMSPKSAGAFAVLALITWAFAVRIKQNEEEERRQRVQAVERQYIVTSKLAYCIFKEFEYAGFRPLSETAVRYTDNYMSVVKGITVMRYRCLFNAGIDVDLDRVRTLINEVIDNDLFYQGLYVLDIRKNQDSAVMIVTYRNSPEVTEFIREYERTKAAKTQNEAADRSDSDF